MSTRCKQTIALATSDDPAQSIIPEQVCSETHARYLKVRDEASDAREAVVRAVFGDPACFAFSDEGTYVLSRAHADYDILILDAVDPSRMARYLRANRPILLNVVKFAIMQGSSPQRRARMLAAGCDDVFDTVRMSLEEMQFRASAVMRRHKERVAMSMQGRRVAAELAYLATPGTLTPRELTLLMLLAQRQGKPIAPQQFCRLMAPPDPVQFRRALKHAMSRLRSKLNPRWCIESVPGGGYRLSQQRPVLQQGQAQFSAALMVG